MFLTYMLQACNNREIGVRQKGVEEYVRKTGFAQFLVN